MNAAQLERATAAGVVLEEIKQELYSRWCVNGLDEELRDDIDALDRALDELDTTLSREPEEVVT